MVMERLAVCKSRFFTLGLSHFRNLWLIRDRKH